MTFLALPLPAAGYRVRAGQPDRSRGPGREQRQCLGRLRVVPAAVLLYRAPPARRWLGRTRRAQRHDTGPVCGGGPPVGAGAVPSVSRRSRMSRVRRSLVGTTPEISKRSPITSAGMSIGPY